MKRSRINQISKSKKKRNQLYEKSKKEYINELAVSQGLKPGDTPLCEKCLRSVGEDLHHRAGRSGVLLWCKDYFAWVCRLCHTYGPESIHGNPEQAELDGWTVRINRTAYETIRAEEEPKLYE